MPGQLEGKQPCALIVGAGIAGLMTALKLAPAPVVVLARETLGRGASTLWAQGGIAAAIGSDDSSMDHAADTLRVAGGIGDPEIVDLVTAEAAHCVADLERLGVRFDCVADGSLKLGREGGHGRRRIVHAAGDGTGREIMRALSVAARATSSIALLEGVEATELVVEEGVVTGLWALRGGDSVYLAGDAVVLATGGLGGLYGRTSNPRGACGRGLALAARAGALLADIEFVQFHPTALDVGRDPMPLATEALRGEGALLVDDKGERIMTGVHPDGELAPRDVVARAVWRRIRHGARVYLDASHSIGADFAARFPTVHAACREAGINPARSLIPIAPAAHYHMGGIAVDRDGRSSLPGLWAVGEVASTGLHGANRLASNSLLEALVFAERVAASIAGSVPQSVRACAPRHSPRLPRRQHDDLALARLRALMSAAVGVEREEKGLRGALRQAATLMRVCEGQSGPDADAATVALFLAAAALRRRESRGAHFRSDFPAEVPSLRRRSFLTLAEACSLATEGAHDAPIFEGASS